MKMTAGLLALASSNRFFMNFPLSPIHLVTRSEEEMEKSVDSASVATAFARYDFPVLGGWREGWEEVGGTLDLGVSAVQYCKFIPIDTYAIK